MKVAVYPADQLGCGYHRLIWPAEANASAGHDVEVVLPEHRELQVVMDQDDTVHDVLLPDPTIEVVVLQRITHRYVVQVIRKLREKGVAVVVDMDDDLECIHPSNPAWKELHPRNEGVGLTSNGVRSLHSWRHAVDACREATFVTVTTPALLRRYAPHGRGRVLPNHLPRWRYADVPHVDSPVIGWPASLHSHPDDPTVVGPALARLVGEGVEFCVAGDPLFTGRAFRLRRDPPGVAVDIHNWPAAVALIGIGIAPLADTRFNAAKSWLKPLELSALGVPWVASPRDDYARLHALGAGVLADKPSRWYAELRRLVDDPARRIELAEAGRDVAARLWLEDHAWRWWEAWSDALELQRGSGVARSPRNAPERALRQVLEAAKPAAR